MTESLIPSLDGWKLSLLRKPAVGTEHGVALLGHAMMANRRSLDRPVGRGLASTLNEAGFITYALDARGHGGSGPRPSEGGDWTYEDLVLRDLPAAIEFVHAQHPELPLVFLGHSLTAHGILAALGQKPELAERLAAVVSVAGNVWMPELERRRSRWLKKWWNLLMFELLTRPAGFFPARRLKLGSEDVSRGFVGMFRALRKTGRWTSLDGRIDYWAGLPHVRARVLAVVGRADRLLCDPECSEAFHRALSGSRVWHWTAGRGTHGLDFDPDHMRIVTDGRSAPLWREISLWLRERLAERLEPIQPGFTADSFAAHKRHSQPPCSIPFLLRTLRERLRHN